MFPLSVELEVEGDPEFSELGDREQWREDILAVLIVHKHLNHERT